MQYEFVFLLNDEEELNTIKDLFKAASGKLLGEKTWGKKTLAYSIKKNKTATFYEWQFEIDPKQLIDFKKKLNFNEKLIRYLLLKIEN